MIVTTTPHVEGKKVKQYLGIAAGEAIMGANMFKDLFSGIRDIVGGRAKAYEKELDRARSMAIEEMVEEAKSLGANAVLGVDIDYEVIGRQKSSLLMVSANGTAVILG